MYGCVWDLGSAGKLLLAVANAVDLVFLFWITESAMVQMMERKAYPYRARQ